VISSATYQAVRSELLLAYVSSQITKATLTIDYLLQDWKQAGLPKPSFVRPKVAAIEPGLVVHQIGQLSRRDSEEVDRRLRLAMALTESALSEIAQEIDFLKQPPTLVQALAEKSVAALAAVSATGNVGVDLNRIRQLLGFEEAGATATKN
jgi:hypothetical protein